MITSGLLQITRVEAVGARRSDSLRIAFPAITSGSAENARRRQREERLARNCCNNPRRGDVGLNWSVPGGRCGM